MTETRRQKWTGILLLSGLALTLSLWGGTPFQQLDSIVLRAQKVMQTGGNPEFFHYPAFVIYVTAIPYSVLHWIIGGEAARELMRVSNRSFEAPFFSYFFLGHLVSASFGLLGVLSVRCAVRTLFKDSNLALAAGAFLATALLWITDTHVVTVDVPLAALLMLTAARTLKLLCNGAALTVRDALVIGGCAGLATASKYNGALILLPVTLALVLHAREYGGKQLVAWLVPGGTAVAVFLLTNPYVLIEFEAFRTDLLFEWEHSKLGHAGYITENGYSFHLLNSLVYGFGWPGLVAAVCGFAILLRTRSVPTSAKLLLLGFPALHFLLIGNSKLAFVRYMLPMLPFLAVAASVLVRWLATRAGKFQVATLATVVAVIAPGVVWGVKHDRLLAQPDIRRELVLALQEANLDLGGVPVYSIGQAGVCARWAGLPFKRQNKIASPDIASNVTRLYIFDSFLQDRVLYEDPGPELAPLYPGNENVQLFEKFESLTVLQFTPFTVSKLKAPLSRKSIYSPFLPDLRVRDRSGPFLELCFTEPQDAQRLEAACAKLGIEVTRATGAGGWYFNRLSELANRRNSR